MRRIGENKYYSFFFDIFLFRVKLHFCSYHSFCPTIYIYIHTHVYGRYIKKGMESKLNPITSVSSVDTACSGEFIFNGIRGDGKCRGLPSNEICPTEREKERGGGSSRRKFHYAVVEFFSGWGRVLSSHRKSNTMVIRAKTPSILRFTSSRPRDPNAWSIENLLDRNRFLLLPFSLPLLSRRYPSRRQASRYLNNPGLFDVKSRLSAVSQSRVPRQVNLL